MLHYFANPSRFQNIARFLWPLFGALSLALFTLGTHAALVTSPPDYQQGETVRIMYVHVPAAWMALALYTVMALAAMSAFVWKHTVADLFCKAAAPVGAVLSAICLITGSIWGKPMWGAWWVWDARLTSMLILFFLYVGFIVLRNAFDDTSDGGQRGEKASQILLVVGLINIPIIKFSVDWWNTLHQGATVIRKGGPALDSTMMPPLFLMAGGVFFFCGAIILLRILTAITLKKLENTQKGQD
ncbi:MAG: heme ABC transporter permease [Alphaproteobacteria bacterium]|nr:heme ABC transporter permease [Alphaproteobacteria bacterium]